MFNLRKIGYRLMSTVPVHLTPRSMFEHVNSLTSGLTGSQCVRNYVGLVSNMSREDIIVESELFPRDALSFYTNHNLNKVNPTSHPALYAAFYTNLRGGEQGDYREGINVKIDNVVDCLTKFPESKRAIITIPNSPLTPDHTVDSEAKCLRELHFYIEDGRLCCSGFMRAQAAIIFPKNIHFIGTIQNDIAERLNVPVGTYHHFITTLVYGR